MNFSKIRAFTESVEKEDMTRLKWFQKNRQFLENRYNKRHEALVTNSDYKTLVENLKYFTKQESRLRKKKYDLNLVNSNNKEIDVNKITNIMYPIEENVRKILYNEGSQSYLNERYKKSPDLRYYNPETTNFKYGWRILEYQKATESRLKLNEQFGRNYVIKKNFFRPFGDQTFDPLSDRNQIPKCL